MDLPQIKLLLEALYYLAATIAAVCAVVIFRSNSSLERAKWAATLYEKFFERESLKEVREAIDADPDAAGIRDLVSRETPGFTDYLNFFEYVGFLVRKRQLDDEEIEMLFGYYLDCLNRHRAVRDYVEQTAKGFEELRHLLSRRRLS